MHIKNLNIKTIEFFKKVHKQYGCLIAVAGALGSPINDERIENDIKIPNTNKIERLISEYDKDINIEDKQANEKNVYKRESQKDHIPFYKELYK